MTRYDVISLIIELSDENLDGFNFMLLSDGELWDWYDELNVAMLDWERSVVEV